MSVCNDILDFLEKDLSFNPIKMLGITLTPELLSKLAALIFAILSSYVQFYFSEE
jgi:hypothetical protein